MKRKITPSRINPFMFFLFLINTLAFAQPCLPPVVASFSPASGPANTVVTITGVGFESGTGTSAILFNGMASSGFTVVSNTQIKAVVPENGTTGSISVITNGCTATTSSFTVFNSVCASATASITAQPASQAICEGSQAQFSVGLSNSSGFTYQWKMLTGNSWVSISDNGYFSGTNTATLTINNTPLAYNSAQFYCEATSVGCSLVSNATQLTVSPLPVVIYLPVQPTCLITSGSVLIVPLVGNDLVYSIDGTNFQSGTTFANLTPGQYTLTVKTSANCTTTMPFTIDPLPTLPAVANVTLTQPDCNGITTGSITINSPIDLGLTYSIDGSNFQSGTTFTDLAPGTYTVTVMTALGCISVSATITINQVPLVPAVATTSVTQPSCTVPTGTITVSAPTGAGLTYSINGTDFQSSPVFTGLAAGTYSVTTQSTGGCTSITTPITINVAPVAPVVATTTITQPTCDVATGSITITSPIGAGLEYSIDGTSFQSGTTFANLAAGTYTITTQTTDGCTSQTTSITINQAPIVPVVATTTVAQPSCTVPTGTITVSAPTGAGLTYSINGTDFQSSPVFAGLAPGTYTITTQSTGSCTSESASITINVAPIVPVAATTTVTQPTCDVATGSITITSPIGAGLEYSIDGTTFQSGTTFANLAAGAYTITTQNAGGCTSETSEITINIAPIAPAVATATAIQPTCIIPSGRIDVTAPTGTGILYSIDGTTFQTGSSFANLAPGIYTITVQNAGGCTSQTTAITINEIPLAPAVATTTVTQPTCTVTSGTIMVSNPGTGLTYSIDGTTFQSGTTFANLAEGTYTVTTLSAGGCTSETATITINAAPVVPAVATTTVTQPTCTVATGTIAITAPTGAGLSYSIDGTTFQSNPIFANITEGSYTVTVQNAAGCTSTSTITINQAPTAPALAVTTVTQPTCTVASGTIVISSPTAAGLTYSIDDTTFQTGTTFTNVVEGSYTITVQNAAGCISQSLPVTINAAPTAPAVATTTVIQPGCVVKGSITVTAPLEAGLTYSIDGVNYQSEAFFGNLDPGSYTVTVMNAAGCTSQTAAIILNPIPAPPAAPVTTVTQPNCTGIATGTIEITSPTGTDLTYSIDGTTYQSGTTFANLATGTYNVTVQNAAGCTSAAAQVTIVAPVTPAVASFNPIQPTCTTPGSIVITAPIGAQYTYSIDGTNYQASATFANVQGGTYMLTVMAQGGCTSATAPITINNAPAPAVATTYVIQPTCLNSFGSIMVTSPIGSEYTYSIDGGLTYQSNVLFDNLVTDNYTITVSGNGCTSVTPVIHIDAVPEIPTNITVNVIQPTCTSAMGGTIVVSTPPGATYTYSIDGVNYQTSGNFNAFPGTYNVTVKSAGGCVSQAIPAVVSPASGEILITSTEGCRQVGLTSGYVAEVTLVDASFADVVYYTWKDANGNVVSNDSYFNVTQYANDKGLTAKDYPLAFTATVTSLGGCQSTLSFNVASTFCDIPKGISPNNDGMNDNFDLTGLNASKLSIFNRYGKEVYSKSSYKDEWFGQTDNDEELPTGTYYYVIDTTAGNKTGWVYINRQDK